MTLNPRTIVSFLRSVLFACAGMMMAVSAQADPPMPLDQRAAGAPVAPGNGKYGGVTPGDGVSNPLPQPPANPPHLIWTGFQPTATGSRVFIQTTVPVEYEVKQGPVSKAGRSTLTVLLRGCRIHMANNRRKLDTRAFPTPVQSISAKQRRNDVELVISLREPASATPATEVGPNGTRFLVFDFPPGTATAIEEKPPVESDSSQRGASSGDGWSLSGDGESVQVEEKGKTKSKGKAKGRPAAAPDQAATKPAPGTESAPAGAK
jgi:hypothetical protein